MSQSRRRSDRPGPAQRRFGSRPEVLESRQLLSGGPFSFYNFNLPSFPVNPGAVPVSSDVHPIGIGDATVNSLGNQGKTLSGRDRLGNEWTITVHGPGQVIITDATPADGVLDDDLSTIQLIGTNANTTFVTGTVVASATTLTPQSGEVLFNKLIATSGVNSIILNGFVLTQTVLAPNGGLPNSNTGVFLYGGVRTLDFTGVTASIDQSTDAGPVNIVIGDPNIPLKFKPSVRIDEISNTVFNSTTTIIPSTPQTTPTVDLQINGEAKNIQFVSVTQQTQPAAEQFLFPPAFTTGRTAVQAKGINNLRVSGSANNVAVSRSTKPFSAPLTGLSHIGSATFGGNADGLALDVKGRIGKLTLNKGLGNPVNQNPGTALNAGVPGSMSGNPAANLLGGLVTASSIGKVTIGPADTILITSTNPADLQTLPGGSAKYFGKAGHALNYSAIVSAGNIKSVNIVGDSTRSEIKAGTSILASEQGLTSTTGKSKISKVRVRGDLVDSVISASYQPSSTGYGTTGSVVGPGSITGTFDGKVLNTGLTTALGNLGSGFYAKHKSIKLRAGQAPGTTAVPGSGV
jgi:hypothetical protein